MRLASCSCLDPCQPSDSDEELWNTPESRAALEVISRFTHDPWQQHETRHTDRIASSQRVRVVLTPFTILDRAPPPYVTPQAATTISTDPSGQTLGRAKYSLVPDMEHFAFTPVPANAPGQDLLALRDTSVWHFIYHREDRWSINFDQYGRDQWLNQFHFSTFHHKNPMMNFMITTPHGFRNWWGMKGSVPR